MTYANGAEQRLTYDLAGNVIAETDAEGNTKQYQYDRPLIFDDFECH